MKPDDHTDFGLDFVAVLYYVKHDPEHEAVIEAYEPIAEELKMHDVNVVLVSDNKIVHDLGVETLPALVNRAWTTLYLDRTPPKSGVRSR